MTRWQRGLRALVWVVTAFVSAGAISSCSALIGADDYEDSATALCSALALCYDLEGCDDRVGKRLDLAPSGMRAEWLENFSDYDCLSGCAAARRCLDFEPVCAIAGDCKRAEECCGFIAGKADCNTAAGKCCSARGTPCAQSSDCCNDQCSTITNTCGGVVCLDLGEECKDSFDCCSNRCVEGTCAEVCLPEGFECTTGEQCCTFFCDSATQRCAAPPECAPIGQKCGESAGGATCCDPTHSCVPSSKDGASYCSDCIEPKLPLDAPCSRDNDVECCSGNCDDEFEQCAKECPKLQADCSEEDCCEGICVPAVGTPGATCQCQDFGESCARNSECCRGRCDASAGTCACSDDVCSINEDCCSGTCIGGACALKCAPVACHDECKLGAPLGTPTDYRVCTTAPNEPDCTEAVCLTDPYCCCQAWDDLCVATAAKLTGVCVCN